MNSRRQYVLLPRTGIRGGDDAAGNILRSMPSALSTGDASTFRLEGLGVGDSLLLDTVSENGPKLVELDSDGADRLNSADSPLRAIPLVLYDRPIAQLNAIRMSSSLTTMTIRCENSTDNSPIANLRVVAFTNYSTREGDGGYTDAAGEVQLSLQGSSIERLYILPDNGFWGAYREFLPIVPSDTILIDPVDLNYVDAVRRYYGASRFDDTQNIVVGVIDSGVGPHTDLNILGGRNTVTGEPAGDYSDPDGHGTHVAGLVGSNGSPPSGLRGVAPNVGIQAYRVFPGSGGGASNYAILKAMILAEQDGCDILNLSLGGGPYDDIVAEGVQDARNLGMVVIIAAGNDGRKAVSYPAKHLGATAVSAMGHEGTFPAGSYFESSVLRPPNSTRDAQEFIADFSNVGPEIAVTGLGVGVLSTLPNNEFGPMSGTSMAAPVVAGCAASLLSQNQAINSMTRDRARSDAIERLLQTNCQTRGFGSNFEGYGLPNETVV